ncbi:hypothetical protein [Streptomyces sp. SID3343]|uniref:hypothetical protein n=1 Tax=Streptomyces sp. SID3343 TaxID=2690260 RepID=UPI0031F72BF3
MDAYDGQVRVLGPTHHRAVPGRDFGVDAVDVQTRTRGARERLAGESDERAPLCASAQVDVDRVPDDVFGEGRVGVRVVEQAEPELVAGGSVARIRRCAPR